MFVFALSGLFLILATGILLHFCYGIAKNNKFTESKVKMSLMRTREKLREFLEKEGVEI